jgi:hypothetical protein
MSALLAVAALALGWLALGLLSVRLRAAERWPAAFSTGTPLLAAFVLLLVKIHQYRRGVLLWTTITLVILALWRRRSIQVEDASPLRRSLLALAAIGLLAVSAWTAYTALGPDTTPLGHDDALAAAAEIHRGTLKPRWDETALWSAAFKFGNHAAVPLLHSIYLPGLALALLALLRRHTTPLAAVLATLLLLTAPALDVFAAQAGTQLLWLFCLFAALWLAHLAGQTSQPRLLLPVVLLAVFTAKLHLDSAPVFGGYVFGWLPWLATLPLAAALGWALRRQAICLAALLVFQIATSVPALTPRPQPTPKEPALFLETDTPVTSLTFTEQPIARAWTSHRATADPALYRILQTAWDEKLRPARQRRQPITDTPRRTFYVEHVGRIAEVRFFLRGVEVPRDSRWRVRSLEGEPSAPLAFDNSMVTACECAIEIDFGAPVTFDEVWIDGTEGVFTGAPAGLRRAATLELKRRGVTHILAWETGPLFDEFNRNADYWGAQEVGNRHGVHLFSLD